MRQSVAPRQLTGVYINYAEYQALGISSNLTVVLTNMKFIVVAALVVVALTSAQAADVLTPIFKILRSEFDQDPAGAYKFGFETENGIARDEAGELRTVTDEEGKPQEVVVVRGSYSYTDPEGKVITVNYVADETGFHAEGDHIPKPDSRR